MGLKENLLIRIIPLIIVNNFIEKVQCQQEQSWVEYSNYGYYTTLAPPAIGPSYQAPAPPASNQAVAVEMTASPVNIPETTPSTTTAVTTTTEKNPFIPKLVTYWGQNAAEKVIGTTESSLESLCTNRSPYSTIIIGYVNKFSDKQNIDKLPGMSFTIHCRKSYSDKYHSLLYCPEIANDIRYCHDKGIKILIGIGGPNSASYFESDVKAEKLAKDIWNLFLGGDEMPDLRPFGSVVLDGINMFMEPHTHDLHHDHTFLMTLHQLRRDDLARNYLITLSPSCLFPDPYFGPGRDKVLQESISLIDQIYVRYTALECCEKGSLGFQQSLADWKRLVSNPALRGISAAELFIGVPARPETTSSSCYRSPKELVPVFQFLKVNSRFRGFLVIDNSFDLVNYTDGFNFSRELYRNVIPPKYHKHPKFSKILLTDSSNDNTSNNDDDNEENDKSNSSSNADINIESENTEKDKNSDKTRLNKQNEKNKQKNIDRKPKNKTKLKFKSAHDESPYEYRYDWRKLRKIRFRDRNKKHRHHRKKYKYQSESNDDFLDMDKYDILDYEDNPYSKEKNKHKKPENRKKWKQKADYHFQQFLNSYLKIKKQPKRIDNSTINTKNPNARLIALYKPNKNRSFKNLNQQYHKNDKKHNQRKDEKMYENEKEYHYLRANKEHQKKYHPKEYRHRKKETKSIYKDEGHYALFPENKSKQHKDTGLTDDIGITSDFEDLQTEEHHEGPLSHEQEHHEVHFVATPSTKTIRKKPTTTKTVTKPTNQTNGNETTTVVDHTCCYPNFCDCCMPEFANFFCPGTTPVPTTTLKQPPTQPYDEDIETDQPDPITSEPSTVKESRTSNLMTRNDTKFDNHRDDRYYHKDGMQAFNDIEVIAHASAPKDFMQTYHYEKLLSKLRSHPGLQNLNATTANRPEEMRDTQSNTRESTKQHLSPTNLYSLESTGNSNHNNYGLSDEPITDQHTGSVMQNTQQNNSRHLHNSVGNQTEMTNDYTHLFKSLQDKIDAMDKKYSTALDNQVSIGLYPDVPVGCPCMVQKPCKCVNTTTSEAANTTAKIDENTNFKNETTEETKVELFKPEEVKSSEDITSRNRSIYFTEIKRKPGQSYGANYDVRPQNDKSTSLENQETYTNQQNIPVNSQAMTQMHNQNSKFEEQPIMVETQVIPTGNSSSETLDCVIQLDYDPVSGTFKQTCNEHETPTGTKIISNVSPMNLSNPNEAKLHQQMLRNDPKGENIQTIPVPYNQPPSTPNNVGVENPTQSENNDIRNTATQVQNEQAKLPYKRGNLKSKKHGHRSETIT